MMPSRLWILIAGFALAGAHRAEASARGDWLIGPYISPARPMDVLDGTIDFKPAPSATSGEFNDALRLFADQGAAVRRLDAFRRGGRVFVGFEYDSRGRLNIKCGRTRTWSTDWDDIQAARGTIGSDWTSEVEFGTFDNFKRAGREERVYAIARCVSGLPGMPSLRPIHPEPRALRIDPAVTAEAVAWLSGADQPAIRGAPDQYGTVFRCLVTEAAKTLNGVGSEIIVRGLDTQSGGETIPLTTVGRNIWGEEVMTFHVGRWMDGTAGTTTPVRRYRTYVLAAASSASGVERLFDADDVGEMTGIWPMRGGFSGVIFDGTPNPIEQMLGRELVAAKMEGCRRRAGLFVLPPARVEPGPSARACGQQQ